jgi:hypothetical protein
MEGGKQGRRTSLILDPPDGKLPSLTPEAKKHADALEAVRQQPPASWMDVNTYDRCLSRGLPGAMMPGFYNHNYVILQSPGYVAILVEMIHDARIIPLDGRPHAPEAVRTWGGDSRGRWEGDTLVVETTNLNGRNPFQRVGSEKMVLTEKFRRLNDNTLLYEFTVNDPVWTKPWTVQVPWAKSEGPMFEYACHEGNYGMYNILNGARAAEKAAAGAGSR